MVQIGRWEDGSGYKVFDNKGKVVTFDKEHDGDGHARNFIDCVRSRKAPNAEIEIGYQTALHCHLGNIVARTGHALKFDAKTQTLSGDSEASKLLTRPYRKHWGTPVGQPILAAAAFQAASMRAS
jgi:hypothetical protein